MELRAATRRVEVFHAADQLPFAPPDAAVVLTIHDLTAPLLRHAYAGQYCTSRHQRAPRPHPRRAYHHLYAKECKYKAFLRRCSLAGALRASALRARTVRQSVWCQRRRPYPPATPFRANRAELHGKPSQRRSTRQPIGGEIRAGTLSLLYRPLQTLYRRESATTTRNRPHAASMWKTKRKAVHSRPKTAPETGAITARKSSHPAKTPIAPLSH